MKSCLVVDDSSVIRKVARRILEGLEFQIVEAEDGEQALDVCRSQMPDAVLLDWNMPKMDGYEFLRVLRRLPDGDRPKVVFCTTGIPDFMGISGGSPLKPTVAPTTEEPIQTFLRPDDPHK
jgi:CheY-like chemotaxis protein